MNIGQKLLDLRKSKQLSQEEVASILNVTRQTVSKWETDQSMPDFDKIIPICELYGISADELLSGIKSEKTDKSQIEAEEIKKRNEQIIREKRAKGIGLGVVLFFVAAAWIMVSIPVQNMNPVVATAGFLLICGIATYVLIYTNMVYKKEKTIVEEKENKLQKQINEVIAIIVLVIYLAISFATMAWHITWILWVVYGLVEEIIKLIFMLRGKKMENKTLIVFLIIVLVIISIALIVFMTLAISGKIVMFGWSNVSTELVAEEEYDNKFKRINIDTDAADVYIKEGKDNKVKVLVYGDKERTKLENKDEELEIATHEKKNIFFSFGMKKSKVEVYIPKDYKEKFAVKNKYGNIEIESFLSAEIEVEEDCGDVLVKGAKKATIKNNYGGIKLEEAETAEIKQSAGDVEIGTIEDIKVKNNYGSIKINKVNNYLEVEDDCGDIEINNINLNKNAEIKNNFGDIKIGNTNEIYIEAKTDLGDVKIKNNYPKSDITLKLKNDCGDIRVNN